MILAISPSIPEKSFFISDSYCFLITSGCFGIYCLFLITTCCHSSVPLQDEQVSLEKLTSSGGALREPVSLAHSAYSLAASAFSSQDTQLYINRSGLSYGYRAYPGPGATTIQHPVSLTTGFAAPSNGKIEDW